MVVHLLPTEEHGSLGQGDASRGRAGLGERALRVSGERDPVQLDPGERTSSRLRHPLRLVAVTASWLSCLGRLGMAGAAGPGQSPFCRLTLRRGTVSRLGPLGADRVAARP